MMKLKQRISRIFELIITFGLCDWFREHDDYTVKTFLDKEAKLHGMHYCCGDHSPDSYDSRQLLRMAEEDHAKHPEEYDKYFELLNKENENKL